MTEAQRAQRNLSPHAEARLAMFRWPEEYGSRRTGGIMDFWDSLSESRKRLCIEQVELIQTTQSAKDCPALRR